MKSRIIWVGHVARIRGRETERERERETGAYVVLVGNPERNKPLGRPRSRLDDNTKVDLKAIQKMWRI
jgi:hypothetical protein